MRKETKESLTILSTFTLLWILNIIIVYIIQQNMMYFFDHCVTHICGCTHNCGIQDILWNITPFFYFIIPLYYILAVDVFPFASRR